MDLIDTHCHLTFEPLADDVPGALERSRQAGVTAWITVGTSLADSRKVVELAGRHENLYASVGIHPHDAKEANDAAMAELKKLARNDRVVAIGETAWTSTTTSRNSPTRSRFSLLIWAWRKRWACLLLSILAMRSPRRSKSSIGAGTG
jgi:predicted metal-dependent TIM-barrel fold hydrolase